LTFIRDAFSLSPSPILTVPPSLPPSLPQAVALFDYSFVMQKVGDCVLTPKGVEQCVGSDGGGGYVKTPAQEGGEGGGEDEL